MLETTQYIDQLRLARDNCIDVLLVNEKSTGYKKFQNNN